MSTLMIKRLATLPTGTAIQLSYGFMEGQNLMVTGTITDKDNSCMEIQDAQGMSHFVDYTAVKFFAILGQSAPVQKPAPLPQKKLLHGQTIEQFSQRISDYELKNLFSLLDRTEKRLLQTAYDSFCYGVKTNSTEKRALAAQTARKIIFQELRNHCDWSREAFELAARMMSREGLHDWKLYDLAGMHDQAAVCAFKEKQWTDAGLQAARALTEGTLSENQTRDMKIILEDACIALDDASVLEWLRDNGVDVRDLTEDLILYKKKQPAAELKEMLQMLPQIYSGRELISAAGQAQEPEDPDVLTGLISKILWANSTGEITLFDGEQLRSCAFRYSDVEDQELLEQIQQEGSGFVQRKCLVSFSLQNGEPVQIRRGQSLIAQAADELTGGRYELACWYCRNALGTGEEADAMALMVEIAAESSNPDLVSQTLAFVEAHQEAYPGHSKALSLLAQLYHQNYDLEKSLTLTEKALEDMTAPARLRAGILIQYCNYAMRLFNEKGAEAQLCTLPEKADQWLEIFRNGYTEDLNFQKRHARVLRWKIRGLLAKEQVEEAEKVYGELVQHFPQEPKLKATSDLIARARQKLLGRTLPEIHPVPSCSGPTASVEAAEEEEAFQVPVIDTGCWEELNTDEETFIGRVFAMDGDDRLASQLTAIRAGAMLNPNLKSLSETMSAAVNDPLADAVYDTAAMVKLLSNCDERFPLLNRYASAASYLRTVFQNNQAPLWLRQSIPAEEIPGLAAVYDCLEDFRRETGQCADHYASYRDSANASEQREKAELMNHAQRLYNAYMAAPAKDNSGRKFARFVQTKELAHQGLKQHLQWVLAEDHDALIRSFESYRKSFLSSDHRRISGEKVDAYIVSNWEQAGKHFPAGDGADLQGSRRNALRSSIRSILGVINDYYRWMERDSIQTRTDEGIQRFEQLRPQLQDALAELAVSCRRCSVEAVPEEKTGLTLLETTARELLDKVTGTWQPGQERYLYAGLLKTNLVELDDRYCPDFTGLLTGPLGLAERVFAHDAAQKLSPGEHIARIFDRASPTWRNFDTAELIRRRCQRTGQELEMPNPDRYISQAKLVAKLVFDELRDALEEADDPELEKLLWLYDRCVRTNRFGYLAEAMEYLRIQLMKRTGEAA